MSRFQFDWTPERDAQLIRHVTVDRLGPKVIAQKLHTNAATVSRRMRKLDLKVVRRSREEEKAAFLDALSECGVVSVAAYTASVNLNVGHTFLKEARAELGWQAR